MRTIKVLQFICPTGMYGAERWILTLNKNLNPDSVKSGLAVTFEGDYKPEISDHFKTLGFEVEEISMHSRFSLKAIRDLCDIIRKQQIDIIHTHGYKSDIIGLIAARKTGIKCMSTPHGFGEPSDFKLKLYIALGKFCLRFFDAVVPLSRQLEQEVLQAGVPASNISFVRNAVDLDEVDEFRTTKNVDESSSICTIGYIGQLIPRKKIDHLLDIFNRVWLHDKNLELVLLGDGETKQAMEEYARSLPSSTAIKFLGFRDDRLEMLKKFDLFVMTSSDEGIPRCLMEAIAMEVPVAAYNIPGVDQLVVHEETGLLAEYADKETLQSYWQKLLQDRDYANQLTQRGREYIMQNYSGQRMATEYMSLYRDLLQLS